MQTSPRILTLLALAASLLMLFGALGSLPLLQPDEGRNAEVAREMHESGAWLVPTYNGLAYLDKPAFFFKAVALSYSVFGENEFAARLPSALSAFGLLAMLFAFCKREYDQRTAALAVLVIATAPLFTILARYVIFDMMLAFFVSAAILASYIAETRNGRARSCWYLLAAAAAGCATLVKGPVGFILPTLVITLFNWLDGRRGALKRFFAWPNLLLFFAVFLPWFIGVTLSHPDFPYYGIVKESLQRFSSNEFDRPGPFYYYLPVILASFFAWSILLPEAAGKAWQAREQWRSADLLFMVWAVAVLVFFSFSQSKLPGYILTVIVALGVLTARLFAEAFADSASRAARTVLHGAVVLAVLYGTGALLLAAGSLKPQWLKALFDPDPIYQPVLMPALAALAALLLALVLALVALKTRQVRIIFAAFLSFPLLFTIVGFESLALYAENRSARALAAAMPPLPDDTEIVCIQCYPNGLSFYLKRYVTVLSRNGDELRSNYIIFRLATTQPWPTRFVPFNDRPYWLASREHPVYLMGMRSKRGVLANIAGGYHTTVTALPGGYWATLIPTQITLR